MTERPSLTVFFSDPRLEMTFLGRFIVRVVTYIGYLFLLAALFTLLFSNLRELQLTGFLLLLFSLDHFMRWREADLHLVDLPKSGRVNAARYISPKGFSAIEHALGRASLTKTDFFLEVARELVGAREVREGLIRLDVPPKEFKEKIDDIIKRETFAAIPKEYLLGRAETLAVRAFFEAVRFRHRFIGPADIFAALPLMDDGFLSRVFAMFSVAPEDVGHALVLGAGSLHRSRFGRLSRALGGFLFETYRPLHHRVMNRAWTARATPTLDRFGSDLTDLARRGEIGFMVGHEAEYEEMLNVLSRPANPNILLVGDSGAGKETMVRHLALALVRDTVPPPLFDRRLVSLHLGSLVAGAQPAELQKRLETVVREIMESGNIILYIPDIHQLVMTSGNFLSAADALLPIIRNHAFPVIGSTYPREFKEFLEARTDFSGAFEVIHVGEIGDADAEHVLSSDAAFLEEEFGMVISFGAIKESVRLAKKYFRKRLLPSSAEELLKDALIAASRAGKKFLGPDAVIRAAETKVNVPLHKTDVAEAKKLLNLEDVIHESFVDQDEAVTAVADALREYRSGLTRKGGPIAVFLFVGPTGVGKTELAKIIARIQFGSEKMMIRLDMSEYRDPQSAVRLIGSPDGKMSGALTDLVREKPYSLVLLDEFEKSHPDMWNMFLQVFDDGRLTDGFGRTVDFQNTIIVATSNAHSDIVNDALREGKGMGEVTEYLKRRLTDVFRPELLNRFSKIVVFKDLTPKELVKIVELQMAELTRGLATQGIRLVLDEGVTRKLASLGYDPAFGARPLRGVLEEKIRAPLAKKILKKEAMRGGEVRVTLKSGEIVLVGENEEGYNNGKPQ